MGFEVREVRVSAASRLAGLLDSYAFQKSLFDERHAALFARIEADIARTDDLGKLPLWDAYKSLTNYGRPIGNNPKRAMRDVRTKAEYCRFYAWLADWLAPDGILEFGAAFGASGMYWLAGLSQRPRGTLFSFEPNPVWHPLAKANFEGISDRYVLTLGTFEDNLERIEGEVSITLIDAIHAGDFVRRQFELVQKVSAPGALVLFDDIHFSEDMKTCWQDIARDTRYPAAWTLGSRVGVLELP